MMIRCCAWLLGLLVLTAQAQSYDPATRLLTLPMVTAGTTTYADVVVRLQAYELISAGSPAVVSTRYDPTSRILALPLVTVAGSGYPHVQVKLNEFELVSAGASPSRIYVNLVAHNEDTATGNNPECAAFFADAANQFAANSTALENIVRTVQEKRATFNFQTDVEYLNLLLSRESAGSNVLRRLADSYGGVLEVDAHAHESVQKNYADVANLLERVSGVRNGIVGGFTAVTCRPTAASPVWEKFRTGLAPASGIGTTFNATVLTLGASAGHVCDPDASGIWRPAALSDFFSDDPKQSLITIGTGYAATGLSAAVGAVSKLLADLKAGRLAQNRMYTASVTIPHCSMHVAGSGATASDVAAFIDGVNALDDAGDLIRWATFSQMADIWRNAYGSQPSVWRGQ